MNCGRAGSFPRVRPALGRRVAEAFSWRLLGSAVGMARFYQIETVAGPGRRLIQLASRQGIQIVIVRSGGIGHAWNHLFPLNKLGVAIHEDPV